MSQSPPAFAGAGYCPKCQGAAAEDWLAAREADLLPVSYFHVVFTLPAEIAYIMVIPGFTYVGQDLPPTVAELTRYVQECCENRYDKQTGGQHIKAQAQEALSGLAEGRTLIFRPFLPISG